MKIAYLSVGSNVGDRRVNLSEALRRLAAGNLTIVRESSIYETEPRDFKDQPWFLNQVVEVETDLFPRQLLARTQKVEREMGRRRTVDKGPRVIDVDILLFGNSIVDTPDLKIPHPGMAERRFVLEPLGELAPDLRHPQLGRTIRDLLQDVKDQIVRRTD